MDIPALVRSETAKIIKNSFQFGAFSPWHINTGWCYELSRSISDALNKEGIENEILDSNWLIKNGPMDGRPKGVGLLGYHEFVLAEGKYYDSEAPDGVDSPYDLPIVKSAVVSRQTDKDFIAYLNNEEMAGDFPCPSPIKEAFIRNLESFTKAGYPADEKAHRAIHVAAQMLWEPIYAHMKTDTSKMAETLSRIMNSFDLPCSVETGEAAPEIEISGEHRWLRFSDGTIFEIDFEKSTQFDRSKLGGQVRFIHPDDPLNEQYKVSNAPAFAM
jgi:hypothetical protein